MLSCLKGTIGVEGCGSVIPASGLFINHLPGISLQSISGLTEAEQGTWTKLWNELEDRSLIRFGNLVHGELKKCYSVKTKTCTSDLVCENKELFYVAFEYLLAEELMNTRLFSDRWNKWTMNKDQAREMKEYFASEMAKELEIAVKSIDIDCCGDCFQKGGGNVYYETVLP